MSDKSKLPSYDSHSRMKHYNIIFDESINQNRVAFYNFDAADSIVKDSRDDYFTVPKGMEYRLDLISVKFYGTSAYDWFIAQYNNIEDPIRDIVAGKKLIIPYNGKTNGV